MVQSSSLHYTSMFESARQGNLRAIAVWLNQALTPYGMRARVGSKRPGSLKLLIEFDFDFDPVNPPSVWQDPLIRLICHRLWKLNSPLIQGVNIVARYLDQPQRLVWRQSVRIVTPASRARQRTRQHNRQQQHQLRSRIHQTSRRKHRLRTTRAILVGGPAVAAVMVGGFLGYTRAPIEQTAANASSQPKDAPTTLPTRPDTVRTALETVPVVKHNEVANPQDPTVTLMFSGDVTLSDAFKDVMGHNYSLAFAKMPEYKQADLAMVNLENPLTRATLPLPGKQFNFKADPESIETLKSGGVDIVTLANNHSMDYDSEGLKETITTLEKAGIEYMGAGNDLTHARRPQIVDVKGQRIAFLAYWGEEYGAEANKPGVNNIREERIAEDIRAIRDQVDWVVVNYHWGQELADFPADWQTKLAHFTIDQGADAVVGHHPHVLQGAEIYKGRAIAYSLGNFIFGGNSRTDYDTAVMRVALKDRQMKVEFLPVEVKGFQPQVAQGSKATDILNHITQLSAGFKQPMPTSVVLDAKAPTQTDPAASPSLDPTAPIPPAVTPPAVVPPASELHPGAPAPVPAPDALPPQPPAADTKSNESPVTPDALTAPQTDGSTETAPPANPENLDLLPGYGGSPVPAPSPSPSIDPLNPDAYLEAPPAIAPTSPSNTTIAPGTPNPAASPQLPNVPPTGNSFTNAPDNTPLKFDQSPPENFERPPAGQIQGNAAPSQPAVSFKIQSQPPATEEEPLEVALAGPMMW
jgi:poly-gamma-glutamate synthesis protein (capsule biosynthesis protein)